MNQRAPKEVTYRLLYLGRHGQGYHNVGIMFYGDAAWDVSLVFSLHSRFPDPNLIICHRRSLRSVLVTDRGFVLIQCYYGVFDRDPHVLSITYLDAHLTPLGIHQAKTVSKFWQNLISTQKMPLPQSYYSSPLTRAMQTAQLTFSGLPLPPSQTFRPVVKEFLRERYGIQSCDLRSTKSYIKTNFPDFRIEDSFTENDELHSAIRRESLRRHDRRVRALLDDVFAHDENTYISMTSHSGTIEAILRVVGHSALSLPPGGVVPVLVKVRKVSGKRRDEEDEQGWETKPASESDPLKAGKQGYKHVAEFLDEIDRSVPDGSESEVDGNTCWPSMMKGRDKLKSCSRGSPGGGKR
jgi:broad specificity phosphatase PhoE